MGLDMYAYKVNLEDAVSDLIIAPNATTEEIFYWRKHHNLHGWMEKLYEEKGGTKEFNCVPVRLTDEDLNRLRRDIVNDKLPDTEGFFFGNNPPDDDSKKEDLQFIQTAKEVIGDGYAVYYDSWW